MAALTPERDKRDRRDKPHSVPLPEALRDVAERDGTGQPPLGGVLSVPHRPRLAEARRPILGIDPGLTGALALYDAAADSLDIEDVPTFMVRSGKGRKTVVDHYSLARIVDAWAPRNPVVWLEQVGTRPGEGAVGAFSFGRTFGLLLGVAAAHFLTVELVTPATWKAALKVKGDKDVSRQRASALLPRHSGNWPLVKHDGRAEAVLIALYGAGQGAGPGRVAK